MKYIYSVYFLNSDSKSLVSVVDRYTFEAAFNIWNYVDNSLAFIQYERGKDDSKKMDKNHVICVTDLYKELNKYYALDLVSTDGKLLINTKKIYDYFNESTANSLPGLPKVNNNTQRPQITSDKIYHHNNIFNIDPVTMSGLCDNIERSGYGDVYDIEYYLDKALVYTKDDYMFKIYDTYGNGFMCELVYSPED